MARQIRVTFPSPTITLRLVGLVGLALIVAGIGMWSLAAALVFAGVSLVGSAAALAYLNGGNE